MNQLILKKSISFLFVACFFMGAIAQVSGDSFAKARQSKNATVTYVYDGVPGFADDKGGSRAGFLFELMSNFETYVKNEHGISMSVEFVKEKDFQTMMSLVKDGDGGVFGLSNVSIRESRKKDYSFSPPYMNNVMVLITNTSAPSLSNLSDISSTFAGMTAYTVSSSTYEARLKEIKSAHFPDMTIALKNATDEVIKEVVENDKAFCVVDLNYYLESIKTSRNLKRHSVGDKADDILGITMPKSNDWAPILKAFFESGYIKSSEYKASVTKHLGKGASRMLEGI